MPAPRERTASVLGVREIREAISRALTEFEEKGAEAEPIFFGSHRKAHGVMLSHARYLQLLDDLDELAIAVEVRQRDRADRGERIDLDDLLREHGVDRAELDAE